MQRTAQSVDQHHTTISVRLPIRIAQELQAVALRDGNHVSATVRRLLSVGLRAEFRDGNEAA